MKRLQAGFSLTELLVSLTLSSFLLLAMSSLLIAGKTNWHHQLRLTSAQEIERYTVVQLRRAIRQAEQVDEDSHPGLLILQYRAVEGSRNCLGQLQDAGQLYQDRFHVSDDQLRCNGQALINGVDQIYFSYGVDLNGDGRVLAEEYFDQPHCCFPVRSVGFELQLSGDPAPEQQHYSAALRRY